MHYCLPIRFLSCQSCSSHAYCQSCAVRWQEDLNHVPGLQNVSLDSSKKLLSLECSMEQEVLIDLLDGKGIFVVE